MTGRILIADDEQDIVDAIAYALTAEGFEVDTVSNGEAALDAAQREPYDLVLLDITMPRLSGTEVCRRLRTDSIVPIVRRARRRRTASSHKSSAPISSPSTRSSSASFAVSIIAGRVAFMRNGVAVVTRPLPIGGASVVSRSVTARRQITIRGLLILIRDSLITVTRGLVMV